MHDKKRIFHLIQSLENGGCENMLLRTLPLLNDFEHKIITLKKLGDLATKFELAGIAVQTVHCNGLFDISGIKRLRVVIQKEKPDIIITYLFHADMLGRLLLRTITRSPIIPFLRTTYNHPRYLAPRILEWITKPLVKKYLANSEAVKNFYVEHLGVKTEKITVIPNGIDVKYFDSITPDPELRKSLGINPNDFVIICVANLHKNKGHQYLLEAFEKVFEKYRDIQLLIVGDGDEKENLRNQTKNYQSKENILFLGKRTDVPQLLKISDCFVLPTLFEGMSNAVREPMASELPIITTDIPENRILIKNNESGMLVSTYATQALGEAIITIIQNTELCEKLSQNGRNVIEKYYSLHSTTEKLRTFYKNRGFLEKVA